MASTAAMKTVFGTAELLEDILIAAILQGMTQKHLLLAQRVSTDWQAIIQGSPTLQRLLGFRPATTDQDFELFRQWSAKRNQLGDMDYQTRGRQSMRHDGTYVMLQVFTYPLLANRLNHIPMGLPIADITAGGDNEDLCSDEALEKYKSHDSKGQVLASGRVPGRDLEIYEKWGQTYSSMHRMLLTQPPPVSVSLEYLDKKWEVATKAVKNPNGVTVGDVWRAGMEVYANHGNMRRCAWDFQGFYDYPADVGNSLAEFWIRTGDYDSDTDEDSEFDYYDGEEHDWEDYHGGDWSSEGSYYEEDEDDEYDF